MIFTVIFLNLNRSSDCEIKEPAEILKNSSLLEKLYKKTCLIVDLKSDSVECFVN